MKYAPGANIEGSIYRIRFSERELAEARAYWGPICRHLQRYVNPEGATLDLGAGYCHFINHIVSGQKLALDINGENLRRHAAPDVRCIQSSGADLRDIDSESLDTVFASNVYEHFPSREDVARSCDEVYRVLRPRGKFVVLQPNFAYCAKQYFDFFDHRLVFTHKGMAEGMAISGFDLEHIIPRFLPYTSKGNLPTAPWLVSLYLAFRPAWSLLGGQMLLVGVKRISAA